MTVRPHPVTIRLTQTSDDVCTFPLLFGHTIQEVRFWRIVRPSRTPPSVSKTPSQRDFLSTCPLDFTFTPPYC